MTGFGIARVKQKLRLIISIQMYKVIKPPKKKKKQKQHTKPKTSNRWEQKKIEGK